MDGERFAVIYQQGTSFACNAKKIEDNETGAYRPFVRRGDGCGLSASPGADRKAAVCGGIARI